MNKRTRQVCQIAHVLRAQLASLDQGRRETVHGEARALEGPMRRFDDLDRRLGKALQRGYDGAARVLYGRLKVPSMLLLAHDH